MRFTVVSAVAFKPHTAYALYFIGFLYTFLASMRPSFTVRLLYNVINFANLRVRAPSMVGDAVGARVGLVGPWAGREIRDWCRLRLCLWRCRFVAPALLSYLSFVCLSVSGGL